MDEYLRPLLLALPIVLGAALIEAFVLARRRPRGYDWRASGLSLIDLFGRQLLRFLPLSLAAPMFAWAWRHRLTTLDLDSVWTVGGLFLGQEFFYYWYHRASHRVRWFWATHAVHHSPNELNLSAAYRIGLTGKLTGTAIFFTPLVWLGFRPELVLLTLSLNLLYQFWLHATWIPRLGVLEYLLNTPSSHRVHHASNLEYLDANYGGVLIVFDRLFGTYVAERREEPCRYGWVEPLAGHGFLRMEFHVWTGLVRDVLTARRIGDAFAFVFGPPGWRPDGTGTTTEDLRRHSAPRSDARAA